MSILICDICGTSYPDTEQACPTCGYARAFQEAASARGDTRMKSEKIRGGRFSKKNVRRRLAEQAHKPVKTESAQAMAEELHMAMEEQARRDSAAVPVESAAPAMPAKEKIAIPAEIPVEAEPAENTVLPAEIPDAQETATEEIVIPAELPAAEEPAAEEAALPEEIPVEEDPAGEENALPEEIPMEEEPAQETVIPMAVPVEDTPETEETGISSEQTGEENPAPEKKKKKGLILWIVLAASLAAAALAAYLFIQYGLPYLQNMEWPTQAVVETTEPTTQPTEPVTEATTDAPTDPPTEAPTDPPTEAPTDPPTEAPTDPPTEPPTDPPTEAPTKPLLDVKLELNYYDLTFPYEGNTTQLNAVEIPNEDVTWISDDTSIVVISESGLITAVGPGRTTIRAIYGDQEVTVKIHCRF